MNKYVYSNPEENGFTKFKLSKKQHNSLFKYRQIKWSDKYEYYYNENMIVIHNFVNWKGIFATTLLFPILVLLEGVVNFKKMLKELRELYNQKKYGQYSCDHVRRNSELYNNILEIIKNHQK